MLAVSVRVSACTDRHVSFADEDQQTHVLGDEIDARQITRRSHDAHGHGHQLLTLRARELLLLHLLFADGVLFLHLQVQSLQWHLREVQN